MSDETTEVTDDQLLAEFMADWPNRKARIDAASKAIAFEMKRSLDRSSDNFKRSKGFRDATVFQRLEFVLRHQIAHLGHESHVLVGKANKGSQQERHEAQDAFDRHVQMVIGSMMTIVNHIRAIGPNPGETHMTMDEWDAAVECIKAAIDIKAE